MTKPVYPNYYVTGKSSAVSRRQISESHIKYTFKTTDGHGTMDAYSVYPGIELIYNDFKAGNCDCQLHISGNILEINYCHHGREECEWVNKNYLFIGKGDLCISRMDEDAPALYFPTKSYQGITIVIDFDRISGYPLEMFSGISSNLFDFPDKFCPGRQFFIMRAKSRIEHIFSELYEIPKEILMPYLKLKVLEVLLFLSMVDVPGERKTELLTKPQIETVKAVHKTLTENYGESHTIEQLSKTHCINPTSLKKVFKEVYGTTMMRYLKEVRMKRAAEMLAKTSLSVADIAAGSGYTSQSKFAKAFKEYYGLQPMEYRKKS